MADVAAMAADIDLLHRLASGIDGRLVLATFGEDAATGRKLKAKIETFPVGESRAMAARAAALTGEPHRNVYVGLSVVRADLAPGLKGGEADVVGVLGITADFDAKDDPRAGKWLERLPVAPTMVLQTSAAPSPSFQCRFLFTRPLDPRQAKRLAQALQKHSGCDACTADLSHVWRPAGGLNAPNKLKVQTYGRPMEPQPVVVAEPFDQTKLVDPHALEAALSITANPTSGPPPKTPRAPARVALADLDQWNVPPSLKLVIQLGRDPAHPKRRDNSRSAWLFNVVCSLLRLRVPEEIVASVITDPDYLISESVLGQGRRAQAYAERQIARAHAEIRDPVLEAFNEEHAVIQLFGSKTVVFTFAEDGSFQHRSFDDFRRSYDHKKVQVGTNRNGPVLKGEGSYWLYHPDRRQFKTAEFLPGGETPDGVLNLYHGASTQPQAGDCALFMEFIFSIICAGEEALNEYVLNYFAHMYQKAYEPPEVCIVLRGGQGVGKNFLVEHLGEIVADYFVVVTNPKHLVGGFNRHLMHALLVFADEAFYGKQEQFAGVLKGLVTQRYILIEPKGVDAFSARKYFRLVMASNEGYIVPAEIDDRRYLVLDVSIAKAKDHAYFASIEEEWQSGGREAFYELMLKRDISTFDHRDRPETPGLYEQKLASLHGSSRIVFDLLFSGVAPIEAQDGDSIFVSTSAVLELMGEGASEVSARALAHELRPIALNDRSTRVTTRVGQARGFWLPSLFKSREAWTAAKRMKVSWPDEPDAWRRPVI